MLRFGIGVHHCDTSDESCADEDVDDFIEGDTHIMPPINAGALRWATQLRRWAYFRSLMVNQDLHALDLHWRNGGQHRDDIITRMRANFDRPMALLPELAAVATSSSFQQSLPKSRKRSIHSKMLWRRQDARRSRLEQALVASDTRLAWLLRTPDSVVQQPAIAA